MDYKYTNKLLQNIVSSAFTKYQQGEDLKLCTMEKLN
jgi:hypothetical protein